MTGLDISHAESADAPQQPLWGAKLVSCLRVADFSGPAPNFGTRGCTNTISLEIPRSGGVTELMHPTGG